MASTIRIVLIVGGLLMLPLVWVFGIAAWGLAAENWGIVAETGQLETRMQRAAAFWLWDDTALSYLFIASMQAAIAAAMIWIGLTGALHMMVAGSINLFVMLGGIAIYLFSGQVAMTPKLWLYAGGCAIFALANLWFVAWARHFAATDIRPMPIGLRIAFVIFVLALIAVGGALVLGREDVFPWDLQTGTAVVFGWMFLGDAFYFLYALLQPRWVNAAPQLWSFLAYDVVLIGPFLNRLMTQTTNDSASQYGYASLVVYIGILFFSAAVTIYYLFLDRRTRVWGH